MYHKEMNSISFKASVQILYIVLCNYCTTCIIYRDKIKFKLKFKENPCEGTDESTPLRFQLGLLKEINTALQTLH